MRISVGSDHAAVAVRRALVLSLRQEGHEVLEFGPTEGQRVDYPLIAAQVAETVTEGAAARAVLVCGTGIGVAIAANKVKGIRAALVHDPFTAELAAMHNDANVLCLGGRLLAPEYAKLLVRIWLATEFEPRHAPRLKQIDEMEETG